MVGGASRRRLARRRARSAVLLALLTFAAGQLGLSLGIAVAWPHLRDPMYSDKEARLRDRLAAAAPGARPLTVAMLGSSRTSYAFHGRTVEQQLSAGLGRPVVAVNLGVPATGPVAHRVYLQRLLDSGSKVDLVLIEVMPPLLSGSVPVLPERHWLFADRLWHSELELLERFGYPAGELNGRWWHSTLVPAHGLRFQLVGRGAPFLLPYQLRHDASRGSDANGWSTPIVDSVTPEQYAAGVARARLEYATFLNDFFVGEAARAAVRENLELCRRRGVRSALVLMPEGTDFASWYSPEARRDLDEFLASTGAPVIDARDWSPDDDFTDSHHLLRRGALRFSERLAREALPPLAKESGDGD